VEQIDITDFKTIESKIKQIIKAFPTLDTVCVFSGKLEHLSFMDPSTSTDESIISETTLNLTSPSILARHFIPHLLTLKQPANFVLVTSGMAYVPFKFYPVYCATKAAVHYLAVGLRSDLAGTNVNIIELVPPYVDTDLDAHCREDTIALMGGRENWHPPMLLEEYMSQAMEGLAKIGEDGKPLKEVPVGFGAMGAGAWRGTFGPIFTQFGVEG
jgi:uncharacterized oxidoreductase